MQKIRRKHQLGQGMTEYIVIVALVAVAAIAVYQFFGQTVRNQTAGIAKEVAGETASQQIQQAQAAADLAAQEDKVKGLANYTNEGAYGN